ncbi:MAG: bifunctional methylenetetrahydrofolate dehydrogenase/methenyltetrahydrofolate cyclohydrolase FolD [Candidatus Woesearchaeota archaeon]
MGELIDGKVVSKAVKDEVAGQVAELKQEHNLTPSLHAILVGSDPGSQYYVNSKRKTCAKLGMDSDVHELPESTSQQELEELVQGLNAREDVNGILVQLPLPKHMDEYEIIKLIDPSKDVDGFTHHSIGDLYLGRECLQPCTPSGIIRLLDHYDIPIEGKDAVVIGRSNIVGRPISLLLQHRNATVTMCHSRTRDLQYKAASADILVAAIGKSGYIKGDWVKEGAVVIDVGINRVEDTTQDKGYRIVGDVQFESARERASYITPVPGGVGLMTIACLMENTLKAFRIQNHI